MVDKHGISRDEAMKILDIKEEMIVGEETKWDP